MKIYHYSVFRLRYTGVKPGTSQKLRVSEGGKLFAIVENVHDPAEMQKIAASSGQPLTGFITNISSENVEARFFSPTKEKGSSDSGALAVCEHLRRTKRFREKQTVLMGQEELEVFFQKKKWWSLQEDTAVISRLTHGTFAPIFSDNTVELCEDSGYLVGNTKKNLILRVERSGWDPLGSLTPDLEAVESLQREYGINGVILLNFRHDVDIRFFSPLKGIKEDNAGSYTVASVCGWMANLMEDQQEPVVRDGVRFFQGQATGKPGMLWAKFDVKNKTATNTRVGGEVELLEVRDV